MNDNKNYQAQQATSKDTPYISWGKFEISAIFLVFLAAILAYYCGRRKTKRERHDIVYDTFHDALIPAIQILMKNTFNQNHFIDFKETFASQETAMLKIKDTLGRKTRIRFESKWQEYKEWQQQCDTYETCVMTICLVSNRERILDLIYELLDIAKRH